MTNREVVNLFNLDRENMVSSWGVNKKNKKRMTLFRLAKTLSKEKAEEILNRKDEVRTIEEAALMFGIKYDTLYRFPRLGDFLKRVTIEDLTKLCLIDSDFCLLSEEENEEIKKLREEIIKNDEVIIDFYKLLKIFNKANYETYTNNSTTFITAVIIPFIKKIEAIKGFKIKIEYITKIIYTTDTKSVEHIKEVKFIK